MNWINLESSNLERAKYDEKTSTLEIEFKGGRIYQYFDVPETVFKGLISASSHGEFFHAQIKGHYRFARV